MPFTVYACVSYSPAFGGFRTQDDWTALHFVHAIKNTPLAHFAILRLRDGENVRIDEESAHAAPIWFAKLAVSGFPSRGASAIPLRDASTIPLRDASTIPLRDASTIPRPDVAAIPWRDVFPFGLVPIPDAACSLSADRPPRTIRLADALASELGPDAFVDDLLRWVRPMLPTHFGEDSRDPQVLYGRLRLRDPLRPVRHQRFVLVDDVIASGAHLRAAAAFLRDCGATVVCAVCAARACRTPLLSGSFLSPSTEVLPDFYSDPAWRLPEIYDGVEL